MFSSRGRKLAGNVGARGGQRKPASLDDFLHERVSGPAQSYGLTAASDHVWNLSAAGKNKGQRPRPKSFRQLLCLRRPILNALSRHLHRVHVNNDRIMRWPAFNLKDPLDCLLVESVTCQAINGFRRDCDNLAGPKQISRATDRFIQQGYCVCRQYYRIHTKVIAAIGNREQESYGVPIR